MNVGMGVRATIRNFKHGDLGRLESEIGDVIHGGGEVKITVSQKSFCDVCFMNTFNP